MPHQVRHDMPTKSEEVLDVLHYLLELDLFLDCLDSSESTLPSLFRLNLERTALRTGVRDEMSERILRMRALIVDQELSLKDREV